MNKNNIKVEEGIAAVIIAAISAYLGHRNFEVRSIKPSAPKLGKIKKLNIQ